MPPKSTKTSLKTMRLRIWAGLWVVCFALMGLLGFAVHQDLKRPGAWKFFEKNFPRTPATTALKK